MEREWRDKRWTQKSIIEAKRRCWRYVWFQNGYDNYRLRPVIQLLYPIDYVMWAIFYVHHKWKLSTLKRAIWEIFCLVIQKQSSVALMASKNTLEGSSIVVVRFFRFFCWRDSAQQPAKNRNGIMQQNEVRNEYFKALAFSAKRFSWPQSEFRDKESVKKRQKNQLDWLISGETAAATENYSTQ